jgi:hypothetical protein
MDKTKSPGIALRNIQLTECTIADVKLNAELRYSLGICEFVRTELNANHLTVLVGFDLMLDVADPACTFKCKFLATYSRQDEENMTWAELPDHVVVAHIVPFFREFVSNMTHRMPISVLVMVPPANTSAMLAEFRKKSIPQSMQPASK